MGVLKIGQGIVAVTSAEFPVIRLTSGAGKCSGEHVSNHN